MNRLIAIFYFVLSLYGCDAGGSTFVHRVQADGTDTFYIEAGVLPGVTLVQCLRSASGRCYYTLFPRDCAAAPGRAPGSARAASTDGDRCRAEPVRRFAIAQGDSRRVRGLQSFRPCVSAGRGTAGPDCGLPEPMAAR